MPSFQVPVLGFAVRFLSLFPDSLPQLLVRCLPSAFASAIFHFRLAFFRPLPFRFQLLSLCFFLSALPGSASQLLPRCALLLSLLWLSPFFPTRFPVFSFPVLVLGFLFVSFRPSLIRSHSCFSGASLLLSLSGFPLPFRFLSSASLPVPATQPLFLPFHSSRLRLTAASPAPDSALASSVSPFSPAWFLMPSFQVPVLGFLFVSFRPSLIRSHSCFSGASLLLSLSGFPLPFCFLSSASLPVPATQPLFLPFRSSRLRLTAASPVRPSAFQLPGFPTSVPPGFPCFPSASRTRLSVCFLSSFPASLPQLLHRCFPLALAFGLSPHFRFLSSASARF